MDSKLVFGAIKGKKVIAYRQNSKEVEIEFDDGTKIKVYEDCYYDNHNISVSVETEEEAGWLR